MLKRLIFDFGMHKGEDTEFFLKSGYRVVAVDADNTLIEKAKKKFKKDCDNGSLVLLNYAISDTDGKEAKFFISKKSLWNSLNFEISSRKSAVEKQIVVETIKLSTLIKQFGVPFYCKIDIEGADEVAIESLKELNDIPLYISAETECFGTKQPVGEKEILSTLTKLKNVGYTSFKLIDQWSLKALSPEKKFYGYKYMLCKIYWYYQSKFGFNFGLSKRELLSKKFGWKFPWGASGPFGEDADGVWFGYDDARKMLLKNRKDYFNLPFVKNYEFWCDWHAKRE